MIRIVFAGIAVLIVVGGMFTWREARAIGRAYPPVGAFVALPGGARLHYTERLPRGEVGETVLLLHGASGNQADVMLPLGDRLAAKGFRVLAVDRPGHGWSDRPDGEADASPARQAELILAALRQIGVDRAIVVGHSWSGALAADLALDHRDFTRGLVLLSPVLYPWPSGVAWYNHVATWPWIGPLFTHLLTMPVGLLSIQGGVAEVFAPQAAPSDYAARTGVYLVLRPAEFTANAQDVLHLHDFVAAQGPRMPTIAVPTAIVVGDGDTVVSPDIHSRHAARDIPGATLVMLPGIGHSPHWADPDRVVEVIADVARKVAHPPPLAAQ
ncbi:MAG TPA: alpha/beta hydrolase [Lichenihabitans sp.]|jgi:pimeloyl-ACP methyl ester carboxylesterase|nr:alpha/beta hydrolase [Lichenihabitans sp.]